MGISFGEFILRYLDEWNIEVGCLCDDLGISSHTLNDWVHRGQIPSLDSIEIIKNYFQEDLKDVVFDGKKFRREFKVIRTDDSSEIYPAMQQIVWDEGVSYTTIVRCLQEDVPVGRGKHKGYRFERVYTEKYSTKKRRRRVMDSDVERIVDKIYDDVYENIVEWKMNNAIKRHGATMVDHRYHTVGTMEYSEALTDAIAEELAGRIVNENELHEVTYMEEY